MQHSPPLSRLLILAVLFCTSTAEDGLSVSFTTEQPSTTGTWWLPRGSQFEIRYGLVMEGSPNAPQGGNIRLEVHSDDGRKPIVQQSDWKLFEEVEVIANVVPGNYVVDVIFSSVYKEGNRTNNIIDGLAFTVAESFSVLEPTFETRRVRELRFVWLLQGEAYVNIDRFRGPESDAFLLVYKEEPPADKLFPFGDAIWAPIPTFQGGRNELLRFAVERNTYNYFIFADLDMLLLEAQDFGKNTGNPYRTFERYLEEWEPAVGFPAFGWHQATPGKEVETVYNFDHILFALHSEAAGVIMPYISRWDHESWHHCQRLVTLLTAALYHEHRIQFNALLAKNTHGGSYPAFGGYEKPLAYILPALRNATQTELLRFEWIDSRVPMSSTPPKRRQSDTTYRVDEKQVNFCHPIFRDNWLFRRKYHDRMKLLETKLICDVDTDLSAVLILGQLQRARHEARELRALAAAQEEKILVLDRTIADLGQLAELKERRMDYIMQELEKKEMRLRALEEKS